MIDGWSLTIGAIVALMWLVILAGLWKIHILLIIGFGL